MIRSRLASTTCERKKNGLRQLAIVVWASLAIIAGCTTDHSSTPLHDAAIPDSGRMHPTSQAGTAAAGKPGAGAASSAGAAGSAGMNSTDCKKEHALSEFCDASGHTCPSTVEQAWAMVCSDHRWGRSRIMNSCGGTTVISVVGLGGRLYHFDEHGVLVGVVTYSDSSGPPCFDPVVEYGRSCGVPDHCPPACKQQSCTEDLDAGTDDAGR